MQKSSGYTTGKLLRRVVAVCAAGIVVVQVLALLVCATPPAQAQEAFDTKAKQAILIDAVSGATLFEKNADELMPPASMSKLMTAIMVFEAVQQGRLSLDDEFVISENAWRNGGAVSGGSTMYAELGSRVKLRDLIKGIIVVSANDACIAVAEGMAGSEEAFADQMTQRARELGLEQSTFRNSTGLPDPEQKVTARELTILARHIIYNLAEFYDLYSQTEFTWNDIKQNNRNPLLYQGGADGLKTGYTRESGYGLIASAERSGRRLILVVNGLASARDRASEATKLMDWGFRQYRTYVLFEADTEIGYARMWGGTKSWMPLKAQSAVRLALSEDERKNLQAEIVYDGPVVAPVRQGSELARLRFRVGDLMINEQPLYAAESIGEGGMYERVLDTISFMIMGG